MRRLYLTLLILALVGVCAPAEAASNRLVRASSSGTQKAKPARSPKPKASSSTHIAPEYVLPLSGVLTKTDLVQYGFWILSFKPKDEFESPPDTSILVGRSFVVELEVDHEFDTAAQVLTWRLSPDTWSSLSLLSAKVDSWRSIAGFQIGKDYRHVRDYEASNSFGAKTIVSESHSDSIGVAHFSTDYSYSGKSGLPDPKSARKYSSTYEYSAHFEPEAARLATKNTVAVIRGTIRVLPDNRSVVCGDHYTGPKMDSPYESFGRNCVIVADLISVSFINKQTGQAIATWD